MANLSRISRPLLLILFAAAALRLAFVAVAGHTLSLQASGYDPYAVNLMAGHGYTRFEDLHLDSDLPPLYPFFLVGVYSLFGRSAVNVALVQIVADMVTLLAIYAIGRRVGGERVGWLAAAFTGFYPYLLFQNLSANDTGLFIMLLALAVWGVYRAQEQRSWRWAAFVGIMLGLAALTKSLVVLMLPLIALWFWRMIGFRQAFALSLVMGIVFIVVLTPWVIRNTQVQGTLTLISTNDGSNLYQGNNPCAADYLQAGWDVQWVQCLEPRPPGLSETETSTWYRDQALTYLRENAGDIPRLMVAKFITLWSPEVLPRTVPPNANLDDEAVLQYETPLFQAARLIHLLYFTPLLALGVVGIARAFRERELSGKYAPLLMVLVTITAAYLIFHPSTRYRAPADPFLFVFAASAAAWLWDRWRRGRGTRAY